MRATWYVYILKLTGGSLYCGSTNNIQRRIQQHNDGPSKGGSKCVYARRPFTLVYNKEIGARAAACREESRIKQLSRENKLKLIECRIGEWQP